MLCEHGVERVKTLFAIISNIAIKDHMLFWFVLLFEMCFVYIL